MQPLLSIRQPFSQNPTPSPYLKQRIPLILYQYPVSNVFSSHLKVLKGNSMDSMTDHAKHAARMQFALDEKAARLKLKRALASRSPQAIMRAVEAADAARLRLQTAPLPSGPLIYSTFWRMHTIPVLVAPTATLHALITRTKAAHGLQSRSFPTPTTAIQGSWSLKARNSNPADFLTIQPDTNDARQHRAAIASPADALTALHTAIAQRDAPDLTARIEVDDRRRALLATYPPHAQAAYLVRPTDPSNAARSPLILPLSATRTTIAKEALRLLSRVEWSRLEMTSTGAAVTLAGGKIVAYVTPDPTAEDQEDDLETDADGNFIL